MINQENEMDVVKANLLGPSANMPDTAEVVKGYDFNEEFDFSNLMATFRHMGFQATNVGLAIEEINKMIKWRLSDEPIDDDEMEELKDPEYRSKVRCTIFLGYTSNMISCGMREIIRFLCQHKMVDAIVTTCGGIEEDFMKCQAHHYMGDFKLRGEMLRKQGLNRIGNLIVPNENYCKFEDWLMPLFDEMLQEQKDEGKIWCPTSIIDRLGEKIDNPESVYYWCHKNKIPVFCPAITDGALGMPCYYDLY
eukprot:TRINITY_DN4625_c0_g1_i2.p1 TRINITY_DN4625_c0_g1~~TRINITY_DN4625_c0_g1_i2.p1  ORF type:complete len:250 (-),score=61.27 TRINITY_DN4625_c0_g1_i2:415-1164(-)